MPLVSVLRDTLGDDKPENDRLRLVWMLTYTRPTFSQRMASIVPFLYTRTGNKNKIGTAPPPAIADMHSPDNAMWNRILWVAFKRVILSAGGAAARSTVLQYRQNTDDYRRSAVAGALAVLAVYQKAGGETVLSDQDLKDIQARLWLTDRTLGSMMQDENLERVYNYFPRLKQRRTSQSGYTSGGEQQMTAIGRALMARPSMILLDEPSMGLAPQIVEEIFEIVRDLNTKERVSFLLAEQNTMVALRFANYGYILENGRVVMDGEAKSLATNEDVKEFYLGLSTAGRRSFRDVKHYRRRKRWLA